MKIMDGADIWRQVIQFVEEERWGGEFTRETDLARDLKLQGDDAYEFISLFSRIFNVNVEKFVFEEYFYPEGDWILPKLLDLILGRKEKVKKRITLGDLERAVKEGKLV